MRSRHEIKDYGWLHDQDNDKIIREQGKEDLIIAKEKGYNTYVRVDAILLQIGGKRIQQNG